MSWDAKSINRAVFRGADNGKYRKALFETLLNGSSVPEVMSLNLDVALTGAYALSGKYGTASVKNLTLSIAEQLRYRYLVVFDGVSVRDALMYQMLMGAVILKQLISNYEWWHFDIVEGREWISFESQLHLMALVDGLVGVVEEYQYLLEHGHTAFTYGLREMTENSKRFVRDYLSETSADCFFLHTLQIYNEFLFDVGSLSCLVMSIVLAIHVVVSPDTDTLSADKMSRVVALHSAL